MFLNCSAPKNCLSKIDHERTILKPWLCLQFAGPLVVHIAKWRQLVHSTAASSQLAAFDAFSQQPAGLHSCGSSPFYFPTTSNNNKTKEISGTRRSWPWVFVVDNILHGALTFLLMSILSHSFGLDWRGEHWKWLDLKTSIWYVWVGSTWNSAQFHKNIKRDLHPVWHQFLAAATLKNVERYRKVHCTRNGRWPVCAVQVDWIYPFQDAIVDHHGTTNRLLFKLQNSWFLLMILGTMIIFHFDVYIVSKDMSIYVNVSVAYAPILIPAFPEVPSPVPISTCDLYSGMFEILHVTTSLQAWRS